MSRDLFDYYEAERAYLYEFASEFATAHPEAASHLDVRGADPSVERLLQGAAFLHARMRKRLDDDFPELSQFVLRSLWPELLRPVPSTAIQQFSHAQSRVLTIPRGARVRSAPVTPEAHSRKQVQLHFETTMEVAVAPLEVTALREVRGGPHGSLEMTFESQADTIQELLHDGLSELTVHVTDSDAGFAADLLRALLAGGRQGGGEPPTAHIDGRATILPALEHVGFQDDEAMLKGWAEEARGRRLLYEFFVQPAKFRFFRIRGLDRLRASEDAREFSVVVPLTRSFRSPGRLRSTNLLLGCTPVVNRFQTTGSPIQRPPHVDKHPLRTRTAPLGCFEVLDVEKVTGSIRKSDGRTMVRTYRPRVDVLAAIDDERQPWFDVRLEKHPTRGDVYANLLLSTPADPTDREHISTELLCSNGPLTKSLKRGDIRFGVSGVPAGTITHNITVPTAPESPETGASSVWDMVGLLHNAGSPLADLDALRSLIGLHDPRGRQDELGRRRRRSRIEAIVGVQAEPRDRLVPVHLLDPASGASRVARAPCRGTGLRVEIDMVAWGGPGISWLLGSVLDHFLTEHVTLNAFCQLELHDTQQRYEELSWAPRLGRRALI